MVGVRGRQLVGILLEASQHLALRTRQEFAQGAGLAIGEHDVRVVPNAEVGLRNENRNCVLSLGGQRVSGSASTLGRREAVDETGAGQVGEAHAKDPGSESRIVPEYVAEPHVLIEGNVSKESERPLAPEDGQAGLDWA